MSFWDYVASGSLVCFVTAFALPLLTVALEFTIHPRADLRRFALPVALGLFGLFGMGGFILWIRSVIRLFTRWQRRTPGTDVGLLICVVAIPFFGAIAFHFIDRKAQ